MSISDNKITEALEAEVEKDISLLFPFIENEVNELALDALRIPQLRRVVPLGDVEVFTAISVLLHELLKKLEATYQTVLSAYIEKNFDRKEAELQEEAQEERECAAEARRDAAREEWMLERSAQVGRALSAVNFDAAAGYSYDDPKHPTWLDRMTDAADAARDRAKGN